MNGLRYIQVCPQAHVWDINRSMMKMVSSTTTTPTRLRPIIAAVENMFGLRDASPIVLTVSTEMIEYVNQNVTEVTKGVIAHGVNCQRKMGSGVAKAIRAKWPIVYERYMEYNMGTDALGLTHIIAVDDQLWVANCYTQEYYGYDKKKYADLAAVEKTLEDVFCYARSMQVPVYLPKIGCGRGGLDWEAEVEPCINSLSNEYNKPTYVCIWRDEYDS